MSTNRTELGLWLPVIIDIGRADLYTQVDLTIAESNL